MKLSSHFTLAEFTASEIAARRGIDNTMPEDLIPNAIALCEKVLEPARQALGRIRINSGYRCRALNVAIGGATRSQHTLGQAADIIPLDPYVKTFQLFEWLVATSPFDQLIWEFNGAWVHVSYAPVSRGNILVAASFPGKKRAVYTQISPEQISALM